MEEEKKVKNSGLATAGMVLGIIGIVLSFIPIINNAAFVLGILALIFGLISLIKKRGKGKAIAGLVLVILTIIITLSLQNSWGKSIEKAEKDLDKSFGNSTEEVLKKDVSVKFGEFTTDEDEFGLVDTKMVVTVKNKTKEKRSYSLHIEAVDKDGQRIAEDYIDVNDLGAGQTQKFDAFTYIEDNKIDLMKNATFKVIEASSIK